LIQKRIRDVFACRFGKLEILINYWDKMLGILMTKSIHLRDNDFTNYLKKVFVVPDEVRRAALFFYINKCRELNHIAFF
jgi:hypothetical protein